MLGLGPDKARPSSGQWRAPLRRGRRVETVRTGQSPSLQQTVEGTAPSGPSGGNGADGTKPVPQQTMEGTAPSGPSGGNSADGTKPVPQQTMEGTAPSGPSRGNSADGELQAAANRPESGAERC